MSVQRRPPTGVKLKKGQRPKWVVRYRPYPGAKERSKTFTYDEYDQPEKAAKDFDADQRSKIARGVWVDPADKRVTVGELTLEWVDMARTDGTKKVRTTFYKNLGDLCDMPIGAVRTSHVKEWFRQIRTGRPWANGRPLADSTARLALGHLKGLFARAEEDRMIERSPIPSSLKKTEMPDPRVEPRAVPSPELVRRMCAAAEAGGTFKKPIYDQKSLRPSPWLAMTIRLGADTGLRVGEISGLRWRDVDLDAKMLTVVEQRTVNAQTPVGLKTKRSYRQVPLSTLMARELANWKADIAPLPEDPVVPGAKGGGTSTASLTRYMRLVARLLDVPSSQTRFHGLRHLYASSMLAAGEPVTTVAAFIGDSVQTTNQTYAHFLPSAGAAARASLNALAGALRDDAPALRVVEGS
ncbi:site-specific integrase [Corynebacterium sp.]|uniref:tyrosine-type recombinase/integrase n=1 Tax=Corynebacterium sp. TaxID=1720 RepID=UPI0025C700C5|nr:site-specific integrase [Corynebacterium sp.]